MMTPTGLDAGVRGRPHKQVWPWVQQLIAMPANRHKQYLPAGRNPGLSRHRKRVTPKPELYLVRFQ